MRRPTLLLTTIGLALSACGQPAPPPEPAFCRYTEFGPLCSSYDPASLPFTLPLALHPLSVIDEFDRPLVLAWVAGLEPRPLSLRVLSPVGDPPNLREPSQREIPEPFNRNGNPRVVVVATETGGGLVDIHAVLLFEARVLRAQRLSRGLNAATLRGQAAYGRMTTGFSLADRPESLGDRFRLRSQITDPQAPVEAWIAGLNWQRVAADSPERKLDWFRSIVNHGSCAGSSAEDALLLAPIPRAWYDEYNRSCRFRPRTPEFRPPAE